MLGPLLPSFFSSRLSVVLVAAVAAPLFSGCQGQGTDTRTVSAEQPVTVLELQGEDYRQARSHFQTRLLRHAPAPQGGEALQAPPSARQVVYSLSPPLQAWLSPLTASKAKHPAILFLHGGFAMSAEDWEMSRPYRDAGFVVMMPALRGENGQAGDYSMFYNEVSDVLQAANFLSKVPYVDAKHIFLAGHSVGGTLAQLCALTSSRFRAAASFSGATDPLAWSKGQPQVVPFDASQTREFQMRSSLAFATSFKCPTRLYFGDQEDWCAAPSQSTAQKARGKGLDVEAVSVPGDHFSEVPQAMKASIAFFRQK